jgi:molybdopterin molybdotransferase
MMSCDTPGLIAVEQAIAQLLTHARPPQRIEELPLCATFGRVLARDITATLNVPPFDSSAMDGYALRSADLSGQGTRLPLSQRIAAGDVAQPLLPGTAARIFTGAPLPAGADCVVMQENCAVTSDEVIINAITNRGDNIRRAGCHIQQGQTILHAGTRLQPQQIGLAASVGLAQLTVHTRVKVGVISTGNELVEPGLPLQGGQIYNSNHYMLKALLERLQCEVVDLGTIADDLALTTAALRRAAEECDLIISSGGVSVGEEDHIKTAITTLGRLELWRLNIKPGKPLAFAHIGKTPLIGLPGNPVSSFVTFCLLARPFILKSQGIGEVLPKPITVRVDFEQRTAGGRREYLRANLHQRDDGLLYAKPLLNQDSATLLSLTSAEGLLCIPDGRSIQRGDALEFFPLAGLLA